MRLVTRRSHVRASLISPFVVGFCFVAFSPVAGMWLRLGSAALAAIGGMELAEYLCCVRRWKRIGDRLEVPTLRHRERHLLVDPDTELNVVDVLFARTLHVGPLFEAGTPRVTISMFVSTRDLREWVK